MPDPHACAPMSNRPNGQAPPPRDTTAVVHGGNMDGQTVSNRRQPKNMGRQIKAKELEPIELNDEDDKKDD